MSYNIEIIDSKDPSVQLTASKQSTEVLFNDVLNEIKGFKHQIILKVLWSRYKENTYREFNRRRISRYFYSQSIISKVIHLIAW